jgi:hypothetical protein
MDDLVGWGALLVGAVALVAWITDRAVFLWRLRVRPLVAKSEPLDVRVPVGTPIVCIVTIENRSPRRLQIRVGGIRHELLPVTEFPPKHALGSETARWLSDMSTMPGGRFVPFRAYDTDRVRVEFDTLRVGKGEIEPVIEIEGIRNKHRNVLLPRFAFEVVEK